MALTTIKTGAISDDAVTEDKIANAINTARAANTAKDLTALSANNLTSGTVPDARFPATLPAVSAANLTSVPAANITGTLPAISGANLTGISTTPADGSITQAKLNFPVANRNLIINGAMQVAQRGTSSTSSGYQTVDRIIHTGTGWDEAMTQSQSDVASGTTPYTLGFRKAFKVQNGNQTSGAGAADELGVRYSIEAQDVANSGWNYTSSSSFITLSFWVKSSVAQNFYGYLLSLDGTIQRYAFETGALSADTWTKVTKTIPGNSNIQIDNDNGEGFRIEWRLFAGTDFTDSGVSLNTWAAFASGTRTPDSPTGWYTTNDATFEITGVQLEVGSVATDFEHRSFGEELALCQRYYFKLPYQGIANSGGSHISVGIETGSQSRQCVIFPRPMRAIPSCAASNLFSDDEQSVTSANTVSLVYGSVTEPDRARVAFSGGSYSSGQVATLVTDGTTNTFLEGSAEL